MALISTLGRTTTMFMIKIALFGMMLAGSAGVGNGLESEAQRQELMVVTPEKMNAVAGSTILLPCSYTCTISGVTHTLAEWLRIIDGRDETIYKFPNGDISSWPLQTSWMGDATKCDASINVSNIKIQNSGRYGCKVTVYPQNKHDIGYLQLIVNSPSELVVVTPDKMNAMAGTTFILPCSYTCTISGITHMLVEWLSIIDGREERFYQYADGESRHWPLQATWVGNVSKCDASITVSNLRTNDSGQYRCEVTVYPQNMQDIGYLQLNVHPRTDLAVVTPVEVKARVGSTVLLPCSYTCTISDVSWTLVEWFRTIGGHNEKVYKIKYSKRSLRPLQVTWLGDESTCNASITISDIQTHDAGQYRCEVTVSQYDKPSMQDIGYLQLNVHNEPEPTDAAPTPSPASTPAPSTVAGIVIGVIAALGAVAALAGVAFYYRNLIPSTVI
ncbi:myelin protein zero-like protein 1 isoform X2 [Lethenteron reissneri]|nr:myelin protein zero-like protein 1 isoform X2 [Lethenteron reissneri]